MVCLLQVARCCCCFNLRRGSSIVLWLNLVLSVCTMLVLIFVRKFYVYHDLQDLETDPETDPNADKYFLNHHEGLIMNMVIEVLVLVTCLAGLYGVSKNKPAYLKPYIIVRIIDVIRFLTSILILLIVWIYYHNFLKYWLVLLTMFDSNLLLITTMSVLPRHFLISLPVNYLHIFNAVFLNLIQWYWTSVVHMQYVKLKEERELSHDEGSLKPLR